ncbi:RDD family protein [Gordonia sp. DT219]|uniref:RDD family protein n=1 Tax=Gordonia sp. DT219 TaxID=3416658 RepID=UPI003CFA826F
MTDSQHVSADRPHVVLDTDRPAGVVSRVCGAVIDLLLVLAVMGALYLGWVMARLVVDVHRFSLPNANPFFTATTFVAVSVLYLTVCWSVSGRTLGAVVMGLRLVSRKNKPRVRLPIAFLRALLCVFFAVGLLWVAVDRRRRSVADLVVRTRVVYSR